MYQKLKVWQIIRKRLRLRGCFHMVNLWISLMTLYESLRALYWNFRLFYSSYDGPLQNRIFKFPKWTRCCKVIRIAREWKIDMKCLKVWIVCIENARTCLKHIIECSAVRMKPNYSWNSCFKWFMGLTYLFRHARLILM